MEMGSDGASKKPAPVGRMMIRMDYVSAEEVINELNSTGDKQEKARLLKIWDLMTTSDGEQPEQDGGVLGLGRLQKIVAARESVLKKHKLKERNAQRRTKRT